MEPLEFLGGRYQQPEQIVPGDVQTFRAREAGTGRSVFIHRISTTGSDPGQTSLLRLLLSCMFRSPSAKSQILDFSDEPGFCYVVTESSPQCLLLREWLQFEMDHASAPTRGPQPEKKEPAPLAVENTHVKMGSTLTATPPEPPKIEPVKPEPSAPEPGEFTRFFKGGMPAAAPPARPAPTPEVYRSADRPSNPGGFVQRPNSPPPSPVVPSRSEPGEFTRMFAGAPAPPSSSLPTTPPFPGNANLVEPSPIAPPPPTLPQPGEYTRIFGKGNTPPPVQTPSAVGSTPSFSRFDDPLVTSTPIPPQPSGHQPSEFTRVIQGSTAAAAGTPPTQTPSAPPNGGMPKVPTFSAPAPPSFPSAPPIPPPPAAPSLPAAAAPALAVPAAAPVGAASKNTVKLLILLGVLLLLAVVMVLFVIFAGHK